MKIVENTTFDEERALYGSDGILVRDCSFDGPADGESALKESRNVQVIRTLCNLRYPFWHDHNLQITDCKLTELCRAALWYSDHIEIKGTKLWGIIALRECSQVAMEDCHIVSPEFGWSVKEIKMNHCTVESEYFMMRSQQLKFSQVEMKGKYSFQYIKNGVFDQCRFDTKDAFWHAKDVTVRDSVIKGEYLGWYSDGLTLINCVISGTQPFCYCKNLKLIRCEMKEADLAFEKSEVEADLTAPLISIKNPAGGRIEAPAAEQLILDDENGKAEIIIGGKPVERRTKGTDC